MGRMDLVGAESEGDLCECIGVLLGLFDTWWSISHSVEETVVIWEHMGASATCNAFTSRRFMMG